MQILAFYKILNVLIVYLIAFNVKIVQVVRFVILVFICKQIKQVV